jgi:4-amino-4-deoxy-L-arabinose transferase-like glycosyltransferase
MTSLAKSAPSRFLAVSVFVLIWLSFTAWLRPLALPDEGRYVGVAWEMALNSDWSVPLLNGLPFFHKPPLFYWLTAASLSVFGPVEFAGRIAPIFGAFIGSMAGYIFVRFWLNKEFALAFLVTLLAFPAWFLGAQYANLDMLVAGLISVTTILLGHVCLLIASNKAYKTWLVVAYACAALGLLAKGLIGVALPAAVIVSWLLLTRQWRSIWKLVSLPGLLLFFAIASPWFIAMHLKYDGFSQYFFVEQHFKRFTSSSFNNVRPVYFFPVVLLAIALPWWPWLVRFLWLGGSTSQFRSVAMQNGGGIESKIRSFMWVWFLVILLFFSIPSSKLIGYILPTIVPLAYLMSMRIFAMKNGSKKLLISAVIGVAISLAVVVWFTRNSEKSSKAMAVVLVQRMQLNEPVFMIKTYAYDLPFYAGLRAPIIVVDLWNQSGGVMKDDWRKELFDAVKFDAAAGAKTVIGSTELAKRLCDSPRSWIVGTEASLDDANILSVAELLEKFDVQDLWLVQRDRPETTAILRCEKKPNGDSQSK